MAPKDAPELAEIRLAVLEDVLKKGQRVSGKVVFPYNLIRIHLKGVSDEDSAPLKSEFLKDYFVQEIRKSLVRSNYKFPDDLDIEFSTSSQLPAPGETWIRVETESQPKKEPSAAPRRSARLTVMRGAANTPEILLNKERVNIGRTVEVYRAQGPSRRNDLAFTEDTEINGTVSREHAHILYTKKTGEYRLYNDRFYKQGTKDADACGLWIIRDGLSQEVHRSARGVRLQPGDEIQLGRAMVRFQVK